MNPDGVALIEEEHAKAPHSVLMAKRKNQSPFNQEKCRPAISGVDINRNYKKHWELNQI